jgi:hypothetical protein
VFLASDQQSDGESRGGARQATSFFGVLVTSFVRSSRQPSGILDRTLGTFFDGLKRQFADALTA